ncbi:lipoprotein [Streptomyces sp. E11-3]|uniref:lipoprotein n=1 Tax=Streptomyces sp. E11-3 TaxID=3110112 RepID=UPI00398181D8
MRAGRVRMRVRGRCSAVVAALAAAGLLTACSSGSDDSKSDGEKSSPNASASTSASPEAVAKGGTVGAKDSACPLPVTFDFAEKWKPKAVVLEGSELDVLGKQGTVELTCEIDAKPAGNIGFLRVWTSDAKDDTPREVLEAFVADKRTTKQVKYRDTKAGDLTAVEVTYLYASEALDETKKERALAVSTPSGPLVLDLGGLDTQEHEEMLPAYRLAQETMSVE